MKTNAASWLCESLGLPTLEEDAGGRFVANEGAREILGGGDVPPNLANALRRMGVSGMSTEALENAATLARAGQPQRLVSGDGPLVLLSAGEDRRLSVALAPRTLLNEARLQRRAAAVDLTAGVSHELANALGAIAGWARLAKQGQRVDEALELIEKSAENAWTAARKVLGDLSSPGESQPPAANPAPGGVDLTAFVDEAARLLGPKARAKGVGVDTQLTKGLWIAGDRGAAWSIVWNLATNAVEALSEGGSVQLRLSAAPDGRVLLVVDDNGPGMTEEQRARVFEPYFTTKRTGTGLGLAMVKQAVEDLGGQVELESERGKGSRFSVLLPRARNSGRRDASAKRSSGVFYAEPIDKRVLVVDDDVGLREMIATALSMRGAEVVCVADAEAALRQSGPFALAVVDLLLPGMRGDRLLAQLRREGAVSFGLIISGTELPDDIAAGGKPDAILRKPFELEDLFERLASSLDQSEERASAAG